MNYFVTVIVMSLNNQPVETRYPMPNREKCMVVASAINNRQADSNRPIRATCGMAPAVKR